MEPQTNSLIALYNILEHNSSILTNINNSTGSANINGDSLEFFMKDCFCNTFQYPYKEQKKIRYANYLSWAGNSKNFPDFIVKDGIAVETKSLNNLSYTTLSLNSSYPKDYIYPNSQNLPKSTNIYEDRSWNSKNVLYVVGNVNKRKNSSMQKNKLITLWMAFGNTFVSDRTVYFQAVKQVRDAIIKAGINTVHTDEIARIPGIDVLENTTMRVRPMYELRHPMGVFRSYVQHIDERIDKLGTTVTRLYLVILNSDYENIENKPDFSKFIQSGHLFIEDIVITDPNAADKLLNAKIFEAYTE